MPSTLVDNWNKTYRHSADHREGTVHDRPLDAPAFLRHTVESSNWAIAPQVALPVRRQSRQDGRRRGQLLEFEDFSQELSTRFPSTNNRFELIPMFKKCGKRKANSRRMLNQPNIIPRLPINARSSGSYLHHPAPGSASESTLDFEMQTQDGKGDLCWPTGLATEPGRSGHYSIPRAFDNDPISVSLVNSHFRAHPSPSASCRSVSKRHPEVEQSTTLPPAETNPKNGTVPSPPRIPLMHRTHASSEKELISHENSLPPLLGYSGFARPQFSHITSTSLPFVSNHASGVKNQNPESNSLLQNFRPGYEDCPIYDPRSSGLDHIPGINLLPKKQSKTADSLFAFSEAKNGVPKRMRSNIPVSVMNKRHVLGSPESQFVEKEILRPQANRNQQFATFTEQSQLPHNPYRTSNLDNAGLPALKASQSEPRVGTERFSNIGRSSRSIKPDRIAHITSSTTWWPCDWSQGN